MSRRLLIIYDGDCPFCSRYAQMLRLKERFDIEFVDARQEPQKAARYSLDLNEGMVADLDGEVHHGADAALLSRLSQKPGMLADRRRARALYPLLRLGRRLTLRALGRKPI